MDDKKLLRIALIASIVGVFGLFIISQFITLEPINIKDIDESFIGKTVIVEGEVASVNAKEKITTIYLEGGNVYGVIFSYVELEKGEDVRITGKVGESDYGLQIIVDKLELG